VPFAVTLDTPKGKRDYEGSRTPIRMSADAKIVRIATAMRDVTERKRLETAELHGQKMEAIGRLAAGVAHDFNNILQSITASLELAQDEMVPGSVAHDHAAIGLRAASRGSYLTHHLLSYARKQLLRPLVIELPNLLKDVEKLLARTLGPNIAVTVRADLSLPTVRTDPGQLQTALLNLAINASHAMPCGGTLLIESRSVIEEGRNWVCLSVSDTGTGMDAATLARATEPFFTTKGVNGSGLGLSMVHGFAEQSGGRIRITSMLGHGTTVAILLPAAAEPVHAPAPPACQPNHTTAKVLLVDDDSDVLVTTGAFLEKAGFATIRAANADLALALLADGAAVDAIVTDYAMPGMNGSDLIHEARLARPGLPGVLISGFTELTDMGPLCEATITLQKPFQREALVTALRRLLAPDTCQPQTCPDALE
jgi:nitrogen-specific signal transduction histidine kinase/CheY-like chemotaxis protein